MKPSLHAICGKILWVDLASGTFTTEHVPSQVYETYGAGLGLAAYYLYRDIPTHAEALGPDNILAFTSGILTGTTSMLTGRWTVAAKSPLTNTWGDANCGGNLAPAIKQCGFDGIFFKGISPHPVYLKLTHNKAELLDAADLWGKDTVETENTLLQPYGDKPVSVACIGTSGEKLSLISGISNDFGRMAARSGLGAVMGSKNLKALVLLGSYPILASDPQKMKELSVHCVRHTEFQPKFLNGTGTRILSTFLRKIPVQMRQDGILYKIFIKKYGTIALNQYSIETGDSPIRNWSGSNLDFPPQRSESVNPDRLAKLEKAKYHCYACPVGCGGYTSIPGNAESHKPEYESVIALGPLLMNNDLETILIANDKLNRAGMDTISAGGTIAFAMECFEKGLLTLADTEGLDLSWGNDSSILILIDRMINRQGIGNLLADGSYQAAQRIGKNSIQYAIHSGGQELPMHDGRNDPGYSLHYAVEPTPGRHTIGSYQYYELYQLWRKVPDLPRIKSLFYSKRSKYHNPREKAEWAVACSQFVSLLNAAGGCIFGAMMGIHRYPIFEWLNAATGWQKTAQEYMQMGARIQSLKQAFNVREGIPLRHTINPRATGHPPLNQGANRNTFVDLDALVPLYWQMMGWDPQTGQPPAPEMLSEGDLHDSHH
ncbi:MAG: aldehyde ferredoxin oxidoreductase [Chloroflexi bacterium HGW-Chloroflexi-8]|nr:MAG: aldehyde ferredoxin oxidoreductase [Chloroflexi bacterium HGW-Chloroflexi-8]